MTEIPQAPPQMTKRPTAAPLHTIGDKPHFLAISRIVVVMKTELEKLREQVQNIE
jgi:hypothetical protein